MAGQIGWLPAPSAPLTIELAEDEYEVADPWVKRLDEEDTAGAQSDGAGGRQKAGDPGPRKPETAG
jgi:hypothetical protein